MPETVFLLLGSNLGDTRRNLERATLLLAREAGIDPRTASTVYRTPPWGKTDQPDFLNAALRIETTLAPTDLLAACQRIEREMGRPDEHEEWGPRVIDIDIALVGEQVIETPALTVPHPRLNERAFALLPLLDVLEHAGLYREALEALDPAEVAACKAYGPLAVSAGDCAVLPEGFPDTHDLLALSHAPEETERLAGMLAEDLRGGEVFALIGELGAGKTCFTRGLAKGLDIAGPVTSPSYVLVKTYEGRLLLHHADFYRLALDDDGMSAAEVASLGLEDYLEDPEAVLLIEWADNIPNWVEPPFFTVEVHGSGEGPRTILVRQAR